MSTKTWQRIFSSILLAGLLLSLTTPGAAKDRTPKNNIAASANQENPLTKIEQQVFDEIAEKGQTDFFITLKEKADLSPTDQLTTKLQKGEFVYNTLRQIADRTQADLRAYLDAQGVSYTPFYIANTILVRSGTQDLLLAVASRAEVASVTANQERHFDMPKTEAAPLAPAAIEPNLTFVNADDAWALGTTGEGMVLADIDTGLWWTHPAILSHYRGWNGVSADHNYNWWDATSIPFYVPNDYNGHGTMTAGVMVGDDGAGNQIGMAPGAKTISCRFIGNDGSATEYTALTCLEWTLAPWDLNGQNPRPDLAPDAVNNSWGWWGGFTFFRDAVDSLISAGILMEFSAGNDGDFGCSTLLSPGDYQEVLTTGSVNHLAGALPGWLTSFSSRGPSLLDGDYFPDVMAPGEMVRTSGLWEAYWYGWGTSFSGPHVVGLVGLMWSANPALRGMVAETMQILKDTAVPLSGQTGSECGGDYTAGPNNDWGYGAIDALAAVQAAIAYNDSGTLQGTVTDSVSGDPIPGATIQASLSLTESYQTSTDPDGFYSMNVTASTFDVDASAFGYLPDQAAGVVVGAGLTVTQDFQLEMLSAHVISVTIVDAVTGWPLYAMADLGGTPLATVWTDPLTGHFEVSVPDGSSITLGVDAWSPGYLHQDLDVGPVSEDIELFIQLEPDLVACNAPGYEFIQGSSIITEDFEASDGGYTITGTYPSWEWGTPIYGPGSAHSGIHVWATGLISGTYLNNEDSSLISPLVDLSSQAGKVIILDWWQWLQTEGGYDFVDLQVSLDGGVSWSTVYGPVAGNVDLAWVNHTAQLDPSFAVSDFRFRFHLYSDWGVTYPGWYLDDVGISSGECLSLQGGLVVGNVYDVNDGLPVAGASVENDNDFVTWTAATDDLGVADGFYVLFSPEGTHTFTATMENYSLDVEDVEVISGSVVAQNFILLAGQLTADPASLQASLELGSSGSLPLTLTNNGGLDASFQIVELEGGFQPAALTGGPDVFIICEDDSPCEPIASLLMAFDDLGTITSYDGRFSNPSLEEMLKYDMVITWSIPPYFGSFELGNNLADYVDAGGKVINAQFDFYPGNTSGRFETEDYSALKGNFNRYSYACLGDTEPSHPIMAGITDICDIHRVAGAYLTAGSTAIAYWDDGEIFVAVKDDHSVVSLSTYFGVNGAWLGQVDALVHNAIVWLAGYDVPWLSVAPITGTLEADTGLADVAITLDAGVPEITQPGDYTAWLKVKSDTPYIPAYLPVNMTVTAPESYGKLEGTVTGLGSCDLNPAPLAHAIVQVESGTGMALTVKSDTTGHYQAWIDSAGSPVTVTVSADEHLSGLVPDVVIQPDGQVTTQDIELRWIGPCVSADLTAILTDVPLGYEKSILMDLVNQGVMSSDFMIFEKDLTPLSPGKTTLGEPKTLPAGMDSKATPAGYQPSLTTTSLLPHSPTAGLVAVFKDADPWGLTEVETFLAANGIPYEVHTSAEFETLDFSLYSMIVISSDQPQGFYDTYASYVDKFTSYVVEGGFLNFFAADWGWNVGGLWAPLPGGMAPYDYGSAHNDIVDPAHPVVTGLPDSFTYAWASHGYFLNLPAYAHIIANERDRGQPTLVEYPLGDGWLLAMFQPLEYFHANGLEAGAIMENALLYGYNFQTHGVPWVTEAPITGTVDLDSNFLVEITFTTLPTMTVGDVYTATLLILTLDPAHPRIEVQVTMNVVGIEIYMPIIRKVP